MHATAAAILLVTGLSGPQPGVELLPVPRPVPNLEQPLPALGFYRPSAYDVWHLYAVGQAGFWRARVIPTPEGAFYLYNGEPYGWTTVKTRNHVP